MQTESVNIGDEDTAADALPSGSLAAWLAFGLGLLPQALNLAENAWSFDASMGFLISLYAGRALFSHYRARFGAFDAGLRAHNKEDELPKERSDDGPAVRGNHDRVLSRYVGLRKALRANLRSEP